MRRGPWASHDEGVRVSRERLLGALDSARDITLMTFPGNLGDDLILAGTRALLAPLSYREIEWTTLPQAEGDTILLIGSGEWCRAFNHMPRHLQTAEARFRRVVVLPSSFECSVPAVRSALEATRALVFARELESYRQIHGLCRADVAYDGAFFFDYTPYRREGCGELLAWRTDRESARADALPPGNRDISMTCRSLDEWLRTISAHAVVRTDRAHVAIAAALLGKRVFYRPSNYHKVPAIAEFALRHFPVRLDGADGPDGSDGP